MTKKGADLTTFGQEKKGADLTKKGADLTNSPNFQSYFLGETTVNTVWISIRMYHGPLLKETKRMKCQSHSL